MVDDDRATADMLSQVLREGGYRNIAPLQEPVYVPEAVQGFDPDLIILDLAPPVQLGLGALAALGPSRLEESPVMVLSSSDALETKQRAMALGVSEFIPMPFYAHDILLRVGKLIRTRRTLKTLRNVAVQLQEELAAALHEAERAQIEMLARMARLIDHSDDGLSQHTWRVARLAGYIAEEYGLPGTQVDDIRRAARLHDLGKVVVSDAILASTKPLTEQEIELIRAHPTVGAMILKGGTSALVRMAERIAHSHHERWDGSGYPQGLKGNEIPIEARIVAVADAYDAMTHTRPYRLALLPSEATTEIESGAGTQFDPAVVEAFMELMNRRPPGQAN